MVNNSNENQPDWLSPEEYQMIVAPSLKVSAELAASRGDPTLFQDLPSMLCLTHLVSQLKDYYIDEWAVMSAMSSESSLEQAPEAACMMVLTEGNVEKAQLPLMVDSISRAYQQVVEADILEDANKFVARAWASMKENEHAQFFALLEQAAKTFVIAVDRWERSRHG